ncbi:hypothetical protein BD289DRAFT_447156 [Coniella lustricola]|uniref:Uncharacterized protein n=1 Tax=Coniella lustricola TaxID=2025994 RepID=A0A2T2ZTB3_9PEZI|nr:hypothetical protein BD289DRAFT_447156 [Coniella lustricola]
MAGTTNLDTLASCALRLWVTWVKTCQAIVPCALCAPPDNGLPSVSQSVTWQKPRGPRHSQLAKDFACRAEWDVSKKCRLALPIQLQRVPYDDLQVLYYDLQPLTQSGQVRYDLGFALEGSLIPWFRLPIFPGWTWVWWP